MLNPENQKSMYINENQQNVVIFKIVFFQYPYRFQYQSKIILVIQIEKKSINFLFIDVIYFPLLIKINTI